MKALTRHFNCAALVWAVSLSLLILVPARGLAQTPIQNWVQHYPGPTFVSIGNQTIVMDSARNVVVTGSAIGTNGLTDFATIKYSGAGIPLWTNRYHGPGNGDDSPSAVTVDANNNVIVTGGSVDTNGFYFDCVTLKYSSDGTALWTNRYNGVLNYDDIGSALAVDGSGNIFVAGLSSDGTVTFYNFLTIKYSGAGVPQWTNFYNGSANSFDQVTAITLDAGGNVVVTGTSSTTNGNPYNYEFATVKYSGAGIPLWTNRYHGPGIGSDSVSGIAVDSSGNVFVTGGGAVTNIAPPYNFDATTIKYSAAGVPLWTNLYDGPLHSYDAAAAMAVDGSGNVIVTGGSAGNDLTYDYVTIKYNGAGIPLWTNRYGGFPNADDHATGLALDGGGNVFVTGYSSYDVNGYGIVTLEYSAAGIPLWTNRYNGTIGGEDYGKAITLDSRGNIFVYGNSFNTNGYYDFTTIKYVLPPGLGTAGMTNGIFGFNISGSFGASVAIEASTNLQSWTPLVTNILTTGQSYFSEPRLFNPRVRFYRAVLLP